LVGIHGADSPEPFYLDACKPGRKIIPVFTCTAFFRVPNWIDIRGVADSTPLTTLALNMRRLKQSL